MRLLRTTCAFVLLAWAASLFGQSGYTHSPSALLQSSGPADAHNLYGVTILRDEVELTLDSSNRATTRFHTVYRIDSPEAVEDWSTVGIRWSPWHQQKPTVRARVVTPDGVQHELDPKTLSDAPVSDNRPETYENERVLSGPLPAVKVGAVVEDEEVVQDTQPFFAAGLVRRFWFGRSVPVQDHRVTVVAPASVALKYAIVSGPNIKVTREDADGKIKLSFEQSSAPAYDSNEDNLPPDVSPEPYVVLSTASSWNAIAAAYDQVVEKQIGAATLKAVAAQHAGPDRMTTIANLVAYLHAEVRYTGIEFDEASLVPRTPADSIARKFGDCKDKAALLVALLRAAGIPAHLALLNTGPGLDVDADYPGMGNFDHAIVYVPGSPDLWIDATAEFHQVGSLPYMDQGRMALVVAPDTTALRKTPEFKSADNLLVERREFKLSAFGRAAVTETSEATGDIDAAYRQSYGAGESKEDRESLDRYMKNEYLAQGLTRYEHGNGADLRTPFRMTLVAASSGRGYTDPDAAVVAIRYESIFARFPAYLKQKPEEAREAKDTIVEKKPSRTADVVFEPFVTEWRYRVSLPEGFRARALPAAKTLAIGPAALTYTFKDENDGTVTGIVRLDSVKGRYTVAEAHAVQKAYSELVSGDALMLNFEEIGAAELAAGRVREALAAERSLVSAHPKDAAVRTHLARVLLSAGLGDQARDEARQAVKLDPKSPLAYRALGWVLQHDLIGRQRNKGFDYNGAIEAYRKAVELDPRNVYIRADLAFLYESNAAGDRYAAGARLDDAIAQYREIAKVDENTGHGYDDNLLSDLVYAGHFEEAAKLVATLPQTQQRLAIALMCIAARQGDAAAIEQSKALARDSSLRRPALKMAGMTLRDLRMYPLAAGLLAAAAEGDPDAAQVLGQAQVLRNAKHYEELIDPKSPGSAVLRMFTVFLNLSKIDDDTAKSLEFTVNVPAARKAEAIQREGGALRLVFKRAGIPLVVGADILISNLQMVPEGDDASGYRIRVQPMGAKALTAFVARAGDGYKILGVNNEVTGIGVEALRLLDAGNIAAAKHWLDWAREEISIPGGDDPIAWPAFPRLYARGEAQNADRIRRAALSLIADTEYVKPYVDQIAALVARASAADRPVLNTVLASAYNAAGRWNDLKTVAANMFAAYPQSDFAFRMLTTACTHTHDWQAWQYAIDKRLQRLPDDQDAVRSRARLFESQSDFVQARAVLKSLIDSGRANESDMNSYGWDALFTGKVEASDIEIVQRASTASQNSNYAVVHTLACLYAEIGKTKEARELLLHTIDIGGLDEPDSSVWYGLGRVAEQYGETAAAMRAYARVEHTEEEKDFPSATWNLAQQRLHVLQASADKPASTN